VESTKKLFGSHVCRIDDYFDRPCRFCPISHVEWVPAWLDGTGR
jgi:hypothetical protein